MKTKEDYPLYLIAKDIADCLQCCENTAREMMKRSKLEVQVGPSGKLKRVPRDKFFKWLIEQEGK